VPFQLDFLAREMVVGLVAEMFAGTGIRDPVTTTSCRTGSGSAVAAGACCAVAGIDAARHAHIDKVIAIVSQPI